MDAAEPAVSPPLPIGGLRSPLSDRRLSAARIDAGFIVVVPAGLSVTCRPRPSREGGILHRDRGSHPACTVGPLFLCAPPFPLTARARGRRLESSGNDRDSKAQHPC